MSESGGRLIPDAIDSLSKGQEFTVRSSTDIRDFVFVEDVSKILSLLISKNQLGVVNIGSGTEIEVGKLACSLAELVGRKDLLKFEKGEVRKSSVVSDSAKLSSILANFEWTAIEAALIKTIKARTI
jgi:nucleoside-diphosphate-sugar epimerase